MGTRSRILGFRLVQSMSLLPGRAPLSRFPTQSSTSRHYYALILKRRRPSNYSTRMTCSTPTHRSHRRPTVDLRRQNTLSHHHTSKCHRRPPHYPKYRWTKNPPCSSKPTASGRVGKIVSEGTRKKPRTSALVYIPGSKLNTLMRQIPL